jgi:hypothetical protein
LALGLEWRKERANEFADKFRDYVSKSGRATCPGIHRRRLRDSPGIRLELAPYFAWPAVCKPELGLPNFYTGLDKPTLSVVERRMNRNFFDAQFQVRYYASQVVKSMARPLLVSNNGGSPI